MSNNRIPDYPPITRPLDGSEPLAAWQDGRQRSLPVLAIALLALEQLRQEVDPGLSAYASWLTLPGNAGKSLEEFFEFLRGPRGLTGDGADYINILEYRLDGDTEDTQALQRIKADPNRKSNRVRLPAGRGLGKDASGPYGRYLIGQLTPNVASAANSDGNLWSGLELFGDGVGLTVIEQTSTYCLMYNPIGVNRIELGGGLIGLYLHDFTIWRAPGPFDEHSHGIMLNGVQYVTIERVTGVGVRGDFIHLGQGDRNGQVRFNSDIYGRQISASGYQIPNRIGGNNRNAISILAGVRIDIEIDAHDFTRRGGAGAYDALDPYTGFPMVAIVDLEPNFGGDKLMLADIRIKIFSLRCGGGAAGILLPPHDDADFKVRNIRIEVVARETYRGKASVITFGAGATDYDVEIWGTDDMCDRPFEMTRGRGMKIGGASYRYKGPALIGYQDGSTATNFECHNEFYGGGTDGGGSLLIRGGTGMLIAGKIDGGDTGITLASTNLLQKTRITTDFTGQSVYAVQVVNYGEGEPNIDWATIDMTGANTHGQLSSSFIAGSFIRDMLAAGALVEAIPQRGMPPALPMGHTLRLPANDRGGPTLIQTVEATPAGTRPTWGVQQRLLPTPQDKATQFTQALTMTGGVEARGNNRFEAVRRGVVYETQGISVSDGVGHGRVLFTPAPFKGCVGQSVWMHINDQIPTIDVPGFCGIIYDASALVNGVKGQALAAYNSGGPSLLYAYLGPFNYGRGFAMQVTLQTATTAQIIWLRADDSGNLQPVATLNGAPLPNNGLFSTRWAMKLESGETAQFYSTGNV